MRILKAGGLYFALVFGAGFVLGTFRVLWVVPSFGTRSAELMETPLMLAVEFTVVLRIRGLTVREYFASRDAVSGTAYFVMLGLFALMPLLVARGRTRGQF